MTFDNRQEEFMVLKRRKTNSSIIYRKSGEKIYVNKPVGSAIKKNLFGEVFIETAEGTKLIPQGKMVKFTPSSYTPSGYEAEVVGDPCDFTNIDGFYYPKQEIKKAALVIPDHIPSFLNGKEKEYNLITVDEGYKIKNVWGERLISYGSVWVELNPDPEVLGVDEIKRTSFAGWEAIDEKGYHLSLKEMLIF